MWPAFAAALIQNKYMMIESVGLGDQIHVSLSPPICAPVAARREQIGLSEECSQLRDVVRPPALNRGWHTPDISRHPSQDSCREPRCAERRRSKNWTCVDKDTLRCGCHEHPGALQESTGSVLSHSGVAERVL